MAIIVCLAIALFLSVPVLMALFAFHPIVKAARTLSNLYG
jgi:hypothetical protein